MKTLVDKYRDDGGKAIAPEGGYYNPNTYPPFILNIIQKSMYNLNMFKMMMKETKIDPGYNDNILLRLASTYDRLLYSSTIAKHLLTKYKDQVDPSVINFRATPIVKDLWNIITNHPRIKYNPNLNMNTLNEIYRLR